MRTKPSEQLVTAFFNVIRSLRRRFGDPVMSHLTMAQLETLGFISGKQKVQMKEVADFLAITPPSATFLVNHLVALGFLRRTADKKDRRHIYVSLSPKGKILLLKSKKSKHEVLRALLSRLSAKEQTELLCLLKKMSIKNK